VKRLRDIPLRVWAVVPLTLLFSAATIRLAWGIPYSIATASKVLLGLTIAATLAGYSYLLRLLIRPGSTKKLKTRTVRIGLTAGVSAGLVAATIYLVQKIPYSIAIISKVVVGLSMAVVVAGYFVLVLLIRPGLIEKLKTVPARIGVTVVVTTALVTLTIHTIRFFPSLEAAHILSKVLAILLLAALISTYPLILRYIWSVWRAKGGS